MALRRVLSYAGRSQGRSLAALLPFEGGRSTEGVSQTGAVGSGGWIGWRGKKSYQKKLLDCFKSEIQHEKDNYETDPIVKDGPPNGFELLEMEESDLILHKKHHNEDITLKASFVEQPLPEKENPEDPESAGCFERPKVALSNRHRPLFVHPILGKPRPRSYTVVRDPYKANVKYVLPKWMVIGPEGKHHHTFGWDIHQDPPKDPFYDPPLLEVSHTVMLTVKVTKPEMTEQLLLECETDGGYMSINHAGFEAVSTPATSADYTGPAFGELDETLQDTFNSWIEERGIDDVLGDYLVQKIHDVEQHHYQEWLEKAQKFLEQE